MCIRDRVRFPALQRGAVEQQPPPGGALFLGEGVRSLSLQRTRQETDRRKQHCRSRQFSHTVYVTPEPRGQAEAPNTANFLVGRAPWSASELIGKTGRPGG